MLISFKSPQRLSAGGMCPGTATERPPLEKPALALASSPFCTIENIHQRAETMTDVLEQILALRPEPHWGINE
jgi:hypothetical protein